MFKFFKKELDISTNQTVPAQTCVQLWKVEWTSRKGAFNSDREKEMEAFTSEEEAIQFKTSLDNAFKLLKHRGEGTQTYITKQS